MVHTIEHNIKMRAALGMRFREAEQALVRIRDLKAIILDQEQDAIRCADAAYRAIQVFEKASRRHEVSENTQRSKQK
jgi:hypothetical protein